jgi:hypothetical protein
VEPQEYDEFLPAWGEWWKRTDDLLDSLEHGDSAYRDGGEIYRIVSELREHINGMPPCVGEVGE